MFSNHIKINCMILLIAFYVSTSRCKSINREDKPLVAEVPKLLIVSYDGFRNEYFNRNITDYLNRLRLAGTYTEYMKNVFPTKTFPNHHTIATGWYADKHGVTGNSVFDHHLKHKLNITELFDYDSDIVMPIWILNQKSGPFRYSGCMMWPGIENVYHNETCHFVTSFTFKMPFQDRVDQMMDWFTDPVTPINLGVLYFEEPDNTAHVYGPDSNEVNEVIEKIGRVTEYIQEKLIEFELTDVNVIYLSDHGMDTVLVRNIINLNKFIEKDAYKYYGTSPVLQIVPNEGSDVDGMYEALSIAAEENGNFSVYLNSELPVQWHIRNDQRVGPITVLANQGYGFQDLLVKLKEYQNKNLLPSGPLPNHTLGAHGYDNSLASMHSFFLAYGPDIHANQQIAPFNTLELFGLFCKLLNIPTAATILGNVLVVPKVKHKSLPREAEILKRSDDVKFYGIGILFLSLILAGIGIRISSKRCKTPTDLHIKNVSQFEKDLEKQLLVENFSETED